tara:strand:- start:313 stop:450 length:138 start_codon:yes stop_codon:yes gene_type:complete
VQTGLTERSAQQAQMELTGQMELMGQMELTGQMELMGPHSQLSEP